MSERTRRVAVYLRVSSDDQRNRETIRTQEDVAQRYLELHPDLEAVAWYRDDGVSGTITMSQRPQGKLLLRDATARKFEAVLVARADRLGREAIELLQLRALFASLRIELIGMSEPIGDDVTFGIKAVLSADERRKFLERSAEGMARAAREGKFCGGIRPFGYEVQGKKQTARLVPNEDTFWREWSEAELVRQMYGWLLEGWSCYRIADHLNALGVPTAYARDDRLVRRGTRMQRTQNKWRPGRIRNLVVNPVYKGTLTYGRRSKSHRDVIFASVPPIVSPDVWQTAQRALSENRIIITRDQGVHLLRSVMRCGICDLNYSWTTGRGVVWYRCNGQVTHRGKIEGRCPAKSIRGDLIEPLVWADVEGFLRDPGSILDEFAAQHADTSLAAAREAERLTIERALAGIPDQRNRVLEAFRRGHCTPEQLDAQMAAISSEEDAHRRRLRELAPQEERDHPPIPDDLLRELRQRLDDGLDDDLRHQVLRLLVRSITVNTEIGEDGRKHATIVVAYRFSAVNDDYTGRDSSPR